MSVPSVYYLHGIALPTGALISELQDATPTLTTQRLIGFTAGHHQPLFMATQSQKLEISFTTLALKQVLDYIATGLNPYGVGISAAVDLIYKKGKDLAFREAAADAVHYRLRVMKSLLYWRSIRAPHGGPVTMDCRLLIAYDGVNNPIIPAGSVAATGTPVVTQYYTLGPVSVNTVALGGVQDVTINANEQEEESGSDGEIWSTYAGLKTASPSATIRAIGEPWRSMGLNGTAISALNLFLRAKSANGGNVANGTPSHLKITAVNGRIDPDSARSGTNDPADTSLTATFIAPDVDSWAIAINTASTIA